MLGHDGIARSLHLCIDCQRVDSSISKSIISLYWDATESPDLYISALTARASTDLYRNRSFLYIGTDGIARSLHLYTDGPRVDSSISESTLSLCWGHDGTDRSLQLCIDGQRLDPFISKSIIFLYWATTEPPDLSNSALTALGHDGTDRSLQLCIDGTRLDPFRSKSTNSLYWVTTEATDLSNPALAAHASTCLYRNRPFVYIGSRWKRQISPTLH